LSDKPQPAGPRPFGDYLIIERARGLRLRHGQQLQQQALAPKCLIQNAQPQLYSQPANAGTMFIRGESIPA